MLKIKRNDEVLVIAGRDKGKRGTVVKVLEGNKLLINGVNIVKKHQKPNPQKGLQGGIVEKEAPIEASNVAIYNPQTEKADRVGFKFLEDGKKVRCFKSTNEVIEEKA